MLEHLRDPAALPSSTAEGIIEVRRQEALLKTGALQNAILNSANFSAARVTLAGGAQAKNIFWQVAGAVTLGTTAHFEGVVLGKTLIAVTLQMNAITEPAL